MSSYTVRVSTSISAKISGLSITNFIWKPIDFNCRAISSTRLTFSAAEPPAPNRFLIWSSASVWSLCILVPNCIREHSLSPTVSLINSARSGASSNRFSQNGHSGSASLACAIVWSPSTTLVLISTPDSWFDCSYLFFPPTRPKQWLQVPILTKCFSPAGRGAAGISSSPVSSCKSSFSQSGSVLTSG